jgi:hypothetical protein
MNAEDLRSIQAPLKERYRTSPGCGTHHSAGTRPHR